MTNIFEFLDKVITEKYEVEDGKSRLISFISEKFPEYNTAIIEKVDFFDIMTQFVLEIKSILYFEPYSNNIMALWFGIFEGGIQKNKPSMVMYLSGSTVLPKDDIVEWKCISESSYWPDDRYMYFKEYKKLYDSLKKIDTYKSGVGDLSLLIFLGITSIILINSMYIVGKLLLQGRNEMILGFGHDSLDFYFYGKLTSSGFTDIVRQNMFS